MKMKKLYQNYTSLPNNEIILDTRSPEEFQEGHVPGAMNISHDKVQDHVEDLKKYAKIHIHCRSGKRAQAASKTLTKLGLNNIHCIDDSGMLHWMEAGYPVAKPN